MKGDWNTLETTISRVEGATYSLHSTVLPPVASHDMLLAKLCAFLLLSVASAVSWLASADTENPYPETETAAAAFRLFSVCACFCASLEVFSWEEISRPPSLTRREKTWPGTSDAVSRKSLDRHGEPYIHTVLLTKSYNQLFFFLVALLFFDFRNVILDIVCKFKWVFIQEDCNTWKLKMAPTELASVE